MGHGKLKKFSENETFTCLLQPDSSEILAGKEQGAAFSHSPLVLKDHPVKGRWNERMFGGRDCPIVLELGCGKGEYTVDLALRNPGMNYVGVDIKGARMWKGAKQATEGNIVNAAFLRTRIEFVEAFFAPGEVSEIWLTFSDPQMKSENSRLVSPMFLERYRKFLKPGGVVHLKTDSTFLYEYVRAVCSANGLKVLACTSDLYSGDREATELQQNFGTMRRYLPAVLRQNSMGWYIEYYAYNQISQSLERKRVRVNRERKRARTFAEFRSITSQMIIRINCQLAGGWSPYAITDTTQVVQVQTLQAQGMQVVQTQGVQVAPITVQTQAVPVTTTIPLPSSSFTQSSTQVPPKEDGSILMTEMIEKFLADKKRELTANTMRSYKSFGNILTKWLQTNHPQLRSNAFTQRIAVDFMEHLLDGATNKFKKCHSRA